MRKSFAVVAAIFLAAGLVSQVNAKPIQMAKSPLDVAELTQRYFNERNLDGLAAMYDEESLFVLADGTQVRGVDNIKQALQAFVDKSAGMVDDGKGQIYAGPNAGLILVNWRLKGRGQAADITGTGTDVVRRRADGRWVYAVDNPFGVSHVK